MLRCEKLPEKGAAPSASSGTIFAIGTISSLERATSWQLISSTRPSANGRPSHRGEETARPGTPSLTERPPSEGPRAGFVSALVTSIGTEAHGSRAARAPPSTSRAPGKLYRGGETGGTDRARRRPRGTCEHTGSARRRNVRVPGSHTQRWGRCARCDARHSTRAFRTKPRMRRWAGDQTNLRANGLS